MTTLNTTVTAETLSTVADNLIAQREVWQKGSYATSNAELYKLLGGCLDLYNVIKHDPSLAKGLNAYLRLLGVDFTENTSLELRLARLVFATPGAEQKIKNRVNAYARVIKVAAAHGQTSATISQFIVANHGIEEIRRSGVKAGQDSPAKIKSRNRDVAETQFADPTLPALFAGFAIPEQLMPEAGQRYSVALVRRNPDGTGSIVFGTGNTAVVNTVLAAGGKGLVDQAHKQAEVDLLNQQDAQLSANLQAFKTASNDIGVLQQNAA
ncbi:MAG: hypothetical protein RSE14_10495 [Erythrobacter sp.]|uniref:hypothetical protein n=1 Tax=Erythrobacter sp. TaxID=1042 RepID=UPI002B48E338|nr:hypothetical protein [Erythrobacter sp.]WRH69706.1 MAG: hypothetical protein RSE14_10495 [Erythrobacter sp.]